MSRLSDTVLAAARERPLWLVVAAVISTQLLALYLLCNHQVQKAQERRLAWQSQQVAEAAADPLAR